jgi:hypothetical protein
MNLKQKIVGGFRDAYSVVMSGPTPTTRAELTKAREEVRARQLGDLSDLGFRYAKIFDDNHWAGIIPKGSFHSIVDGDWDAMRGGYKNQWSYLSYASAKFALAEWDGSGYPKNFLSSLISDDMTVWP